jgi:hypothetical protein
VDAGLKEAFVAFVPLCEIELGCGLRPYCCFSHEATTGTKVDAGLKEAFVPLCEIEFRVRGNTINPKMDTKKGFPRFGGNPYASPHISSILRKHVLSCCHLTSPVRQNGVRGYVSSFYLFSCFGGNVPMFFQSAKSESLPDVRTGSRWQRGFQCLAESRPACCPVASSVRQAPHRLCGPIARSVDFHTPTAIIKTRV